MAKWAEIKCPNCAEQDALWEGMERSLEESDAREARLEAKLAKAVVALRGWIDFANAEGMPVLLSDLEAAELKGQGDD